MKKIKCALIGSGNIGTDLIYKIMRSPVLEPMWMVGIDAESEGLKRAREMGLKTTHEVSIWNSHLSLVIRPAGRGNKK